MDFFGGVNIYETFYRYFLSLCFILKYENTEVFQLQKLERLSIKIGKAELYIRFLRNCNTFNAIPKILSFNLPYTNEFKITVDSKFIRKRLLRSALNKHQDELKKLENNHSNILQTLTMKLPSVNLHIFKKKYIY